MPKIIWNAPSGRTYSVPYEGEPTEAQVQAVFEAFEKAEAEYLKKDKENSSRKRPVPSNDQQAPKQTSAKSSETFAPSQVKTETKKSEPFDIAGFLKAHSGPNTPVGALKPELQPNVQAPPGVKKIAPAQRPPQAKHSAPDVIPSSFKRYSGKSPEEKRQMVYDDYGISQSAVDKAVKLGHSLIQQDDGGVVPKITIVRRLARVGAAPMQASRGDTFGDLMSQHMFATEYGSIPSPMTRASASMGQGKALTSGRRSALKGADTFSAALGSMALPHFEQSYRQALAEGRMTPEEKTSTMAQFGQLGLALGTAGAFAVSKSSKLGEVGRLAMGAIDASYAIPSALTLADPNALKEEKIGAGLIMGMMFGVPVAMAGISKGVSGYRSMRSAISTAKEFKIPVSLSKLFIESINSGDRNAIKSVVAKMPEEAQALVTKRIGEWLDMPDYIYLKVSNLIERSGPSARTTIESANYNADRDVAGFFGMADNPTPYTDASIKRLDERIASDLDEFNRLNSLISDENNRIRPDADPVLVQQFNDHVKLMREHLDAKKRISYDLSQEKVASATVDNLTPIIDEIGAGKSANEAIVRIRRPRLDTDSLTPDDVSKAVEAESGNTVTDPKLLQILEALKAPNSTTGFSVDEMIELTPPLARIGKMFDTFDVVDGIIVLGRSDGTKIAIGKSPGLPKASPVEDGTVIGMMSSVDKAGVPARWWYSVMKNGLNKQGDLTHVIDVADSTLQEHPIYHELFHVAEDIQLLPEQFLNDIYNYYSTDRGMNEIIEAYNNRGWAINKDILTQLGPRERAAMGFEMYERFRENANLWESASNRIKEFFDALRGWVTKNEEFALRSKALNAFRQLEKKSTWNPEVKNKVTAGSGRAKAGTPIEGAEASGLAYKDLDGEGSAPGAMRSTGFYESTDVDYWLTPPMEQVIDGHRSSVYQFMAKYNSGDPIIDIEFSHPAITKGTRTFPNWMQIRSTYAMVMGKGAGIDAYEKIIKFAKAKGFKGFARDHAGNTLDSQVLWTALANRGYEPLFVDRNGVPLSVSTTKTSPASKELPFNLRLATTYSKYTELFNRLKALNALSHDEQIALMPYIKKGKVFMTAYDDISKRGNAYEKGYVFPGEKFEKLKAIPDSEDIEIMRETISMMEEALDEVLPEWRKQMGIITDPNNLSSLGSGSPGELPLFSRKYTKENMELEVAKMPDPRQRKGVTQYGFVGRDNVSKEVLGKVVLKNKARNAWLSVFEDKWVQMVQVLTNSAYGNKGALDTVDHALEYFRKQGKIGVARYESMNTIHDHAFLCQLVQEGYKPLMVDLNGVPIAISTTKGIASTHAYPAPVRTAITAIKYLEEYAKLDVSKLTPEAARELASMADDAKKGLAQYQKNAHLGNKWKYPNAVDGEEYMKLVNMKSDPIVQRLKYATEAMRDLRLNIRNRLSPPSLMDGRPSMLPAKTEGMYSIRFDDERLPFAVNDEAIANELERIGSHMFENVYDPVTHEGLRTSAEAMGLIGKGEEIVKRILTSTGDEAYRNSSLSGVETIALEAHFYDLEGERAKLVRKKNITPEDEARIKELEDKLYMLYKAIDIAGHSWHETGIARQWTDNFTYSAPILQKRFESVMKRKATPAEIAKMNEMAEALKTEVVGENLLNQSMENLASIMEEIDKKVKENRKRGEASIPKKGKKVPVDASDATYLSEDVIKLLSDSSNTTEESVPVVDDKTPEEVKPKPKKKNSKKSEEPTQALAPESPPVPEQAKFTRKGDVIEWVDAEGQTRTVLLNNSNNTIFTRAEEISKNLKRLDDKLASTIVSRHSMKFDMNNPESKALHDKLVESENLLRQAIDKHNEELDTLASIGIHIQESLMKMRDADGITSLSGYKFTSDEVKSIKTMMDGFIETGHTLNEALEKTRDMMFPGSTSITLDDIGNAWAGQAKDKDPVPMIERIKRAYKAEVRARVLLHQLQDGTIDPIAYKTQLELLKQERAKTCLEVVRSKERTKMYRSAINQLLGVYTPEREYFLEKVRHFMREMALTDVFSRVFDFNSNMINLFLEGGVVRPVAALHDALLHPRDVLKGNRAFGSVIKPFATIRSMHGTTEPFTKQLNRIIKQGDPYLSAKVEVRGKPWIFSRLTALTDFVARDTMMNMVADEVSKLPRISAQEAYDIAFLEAERLVYMNDNIASKMMQAMLGYVRKTHGGGWHGVTGLAVDLFLGRFPKVVTNILVRQLEYIPIIGHAKTLLSHVLMSNKMKPMSIADRRLLAYSFARNNLGIPLTLVGMKLYESGALDPLILAEDPNTGRIDFRPWVNFIPGALQVVLLGARLQSIRQKARTPEQQRRAYTRAVIDSCTSTSWTTGIREMGEVLSNPDVIDTYFGQMAGKQIPQAVRNFARYQDITDTGETSRFKKGFAEAFMQYVPRTSWNPEFNRQYLAPSTPGHDLITQTVKAINPEIRFVYKRPPRQKDETLEDYKRRLDYVERGTAYNLSLMMSSGLGSVSEGWIEQAIKEISSEYSSAYADMMERVPKPIDMGKTVKNKLTPVSDAKSDKSLKELLQRSDIIKTRGEQLRKADLSKVTK